MFRSISACNFANSEITGAKKYFNPEKSASALLPAAKAQAPIPLVSISFSQIRGIISIPLKITSPLAKQKKPPHKKQNTESARPLVNCAMRETPIVVPQAEKILGLNP